MPSLLAATIGTPLTSASSAAYGRPSRVRGATSMSTPPKSSPVGRSSKNVIASIAFTVRACCRTSGATRPPLANHRRACGYFGSNSTSASMAISHDRSASSAPTKPTIGPGRPGARAMFGGVSGATPGGSSVMRSGSTLNPTINPRRSFS